MNSKKITKNNKERGKTLATFISTMVLLVVAIVGQAQGASAQFTFMGDYDRSFAAPRGYFVEAEEVDPTLTGARSWLYSGELLPDGSIVAGGRIMGSPSAGNGDFWLRKFTASGAVDTSFGGGSGFVRTNFFTDSFGTESVDLPYSFKRQPDGKILAAGRCIVGPPAPQTLGFGSDVCVIRYNANGTLDTSFGGNTLVYGDFRQGGTTYSMTNGAGKAMYRSGVSENGLVYGTNGNVWEMAIQSDGKIILAGETTDDLTPYVQGAGTPRNAGYIMRLNPNGSLDTSFGTNGIAKFAAPIVGTNCYPSRRFYGIALQSDGRIVAAAHDSVVNSSCTPGNRFVVTRWTASGQFETARYLDNNTTFNNQRERATVARFTRDGNKILVSGSYDCKATLVRLNSADLSIDTTFGTNGITGYAQSCGVSTANFGTTLYLQAIQPDGRLLGIDDTFISGTRTVRFNPDGKGDQSFGNASWNGTVGLLGRLDLQVTNYNGVINPLNAGTALVRPNGRINLVGFSFAHSGLGISRSVVSQENTVFKNGIYSDFTNDGRSEIAVYRPGDGVWYQLDSRNNNFSAFKFGISTDKLAPADYDGDGKTDRAVVRDGVWYIDQSANGQVRYANFGVAGDLPRPGDFDGDGKADIGVFRPSTGTWYFLRSITGQFDGIKFGQAGDVPMLGDYDADGKTDFTVFRPSNGVWYIYRSSDNQVQANVFGLNGDVPLNGDFHGDSKSDIAVFRPSDRTWYIAWPTGVPAQNFDAIPFGLSTDTPVPADYDNDGKTDVAVYRNGNWWILQSGNGQVSATQFGLGSDKPVPAAYQP